MELDNKVVLKELSKIGDNIDAVKEQHRKENERIAAELKEMQDKYVQNVAELNKELGAKGATLEQVQAEVLEMKAKSGRIAGGDVLVKKFASLQEKLADVITQHSAEIAGVEKNRKMETIEFDTKDVAAIASANLSGDNYKTYLDYRAGMEPTGQIRFRSLVSVTQSAGDFVQFPRANTPIGEGSFGRQTEGSAKAQVDRDWTMIDLTLRAMAGFGIVSRQALRNIPWLNTWLPQSMLENLLDQEDAEFSNSLVAAASGSTTLSGSPNIAEKLIGYVKNLYKAKYSANGIAVDPEVWNDLMILRPGTDNPYSLPNPVTVDANGNVRIIGRTVYPVNWLTGRRVVVGDWTKAVIVQSEGLTLRQSESHSDTFTKNQVTFLLERTEGLAVFRPDAFITTTV